MQNFFTNDYLYSNNLSKECEVYRENAKNKKINNNSLNNYFYKCKKTKCICNIRIFSVNSFK